jgi:hypothetical protein
MKHSLIFTIVLTLITIPLQAQGLFNKLSTAQLANVFKEEGYSYEIDSDGDIRWKLEGVTTLVARQSEGECISFRVSFKNNSTTLSKVNEWNKLKRYGRSFLDDDGDPVLQADLDLAGGVTEDRIKDFLKTCRALMLAWSNEVL